MQAFWTMRRRSQRFDNGRLQAATRQKQMQMLEFVQSRPTKSVEILGVPVLRPPKGSKKRNPPNMNPLLNWGD